jgi:hypothetical protein
MGRFQELSAYVNAFGPSAHWILERVANACYVHATPYSIEQIGSPPTPKACRIDGVVGILRDLPKNQIGGFFGHLPLCFSWNEPFPMQPLIPMVAYFAKP